MGDSITIFDTFSLDPPPSVVGDQSTSISEEDKAAVDAIIDKHQQRWSEILEERYSADQPRDEKGRWSGGGGTKSFAGHNYHSNETLSGHLVSDGKGGFKPDADRQALHEQILKSEVSNVAPSEHPTATILGGGPASGKSSAVDDPKMGVPDAKKNEAVLINPDKLMEKLPEYQTQRAAGNPDAAHNAHEEASYLAKRLVGLAIANHQSYVLDGTGDKSVPSAMAKIAVPRANGYTVHGVYVTCPTATAIARDQARGSQEGPNKGRFVPPNAIVNIHASVSAIVPSIASSFDTFKLVDTTNSKEGEPAHVIATATHDQPIQVTDADAYQKFLEKAPTDAASLKKIMTGEN
jgi:predicted ABC-type ATPase